MIKFLSIFLATILGLATAIAREAEPWTSWQAALQRNHPLTGKIWSAREKSFITPSRLGEAVRAARFVLLGEVHDNRDHHRLQAWLIERAARSRKPAVVMEMIARDKAPALRAYLSRPGANAQGLGAALDWEARGWPKWEMYQPIAEATLRLNLSIHAGDSDRSTVKSVGRKGLDVLEPERRSALLLDKPLGEPLQKALLDELYGSHCELVPRKAMRPMLNVQRLRDAVLTDSLIDAAGEKGAILIAGNGHVRTDRAVPWYLSRRAPEAKIITVMLLEVEADAKKPEDLIPDGPEGKPAANYIWFTPRAEREDPCKSLRKRFAK